VHGAEKVDERRRDKKKMKRNKLIFMAFLGKFEKE
jgi:hypothetical protein